jgi:hypothetical protein
MPVAARRCLVLVALGLGCAPVEDPCQAALSHLAACGDHRGAELLAADCDPELAKEVLDVDCSGASAMGKADGTDSEDGLAATWDRPEVGLLTRGSARGGCQGTLVAPQAVLTAAHCVSFATRTFGVTEGVTFDVRASPEAPVQSFVVAEAKSFGGSQDARAQDVALLRLADAVPAELATPAGIADEDPGSFGTVTYFFNPRSSCRRVDPPGVRLVREVFWWRSLWTCPGDSGGPIFAGALGDRGPVVRLVQGSYGVTLPAPGNGDMFGGPSGVPVELWPALSDPVAMRAQLVATLDAWSAE